MTEERPNRAARTIGVIVAVALSVAAGVGISMVTDSMPTATPRPACTPTQIRFRDIMEPSWTAIFSDSMDANPPAGWDGYQWGTPEDEQCEIRVEAIATEGTGSHAFDVPAATAIFDNCFEWTRQSAAKYHWVRSYIRLLNDYPDSVAFVPLSLGSCDEAACGTPTPIPWDYKWDAYLEINTDGSVTAYLYTGDPPSGAYESDTTTTTLELDTWYQVDVATCHDASEGYLVLKINDVERAAVLMEDSYYNGLPTQLLIGRYFGDDGTDGDILFDDVSWYTNSVCEPLATPYTTDTPTPAAWVSEVLPRPVPTGTPCTDWNLRSGCGLNDSFIEVGVPISVSLAGWTIEVEEGISETLECQYEYKVDNRTWPLKVIWMDQMEDATGDDWCTTLPITGLVHLLDDNGSLIDSRYYTATMAAGNSWAAVDWDDPLGTWDECTPSPGH